MLEDAAAVQAALGPIRAAILAALDEPGSATTVAAAAYAIAVNARTVSEVGAIIRNAEGARLPTLTIDTVIGFASPDDRAAFADEIHSAATALAAKYHHDDGRPHRLTVSSYPRPKQPS